MAIKFIPSSPDLPMNSKIIDIITSSTTPYECFKGKLNITDDQNN